MHTIDLMEEKADDCIIEAMLHPRGSMERGYWMANFRLFVQHAAEAKAAL